MRQLAAACIIQHHDESNERHSVLLGYNLNRKGWELSGGKNEGNEHIFETAVRELSEETGLDLERYAIQFVRHGDYEDDADGLYWYCVLFDAFCLQRYAVPKPPEPKNHREWRWFTLEELRAVAKDMTKPCRDVLFRRGLLPTAIVG